MLEVSSMEDVMDELEVLEVTETDAALLRDLLEELEDEETMNKDDDNNASNFVVQSAVEAGNDNRAIKYAFGEETLVEQNDFYVDDSSWPVEMMESSNGCSLLHADDMAIADWYAGDGAVGVLGFEYCNDSVGDYSYLSNEMTYSCLWEEDS